VRLKVQNETYKNTEGTVEEYSIENHKYLIAPDVNPDELVGVDAKNLVLIELVPG